MNAEKSVTRIAITYNPPRFKFEYTKGPRKYHKNVRMEKYLNGKKDYNAFPSVERSLEVISIVEALTDRHGELHQVPADSMERMIEKLFSSCVDEAADLEGHQPEVELDPSTTKYELDDYQNMRVNMAVESGTLTLSPLKVARDPLHVSEDMDLKVYRDSLSSTQTATASEIEAIIRDSAITKLQNGPRESHIQMSASPTTSSKERERLQEYGDLNRVSEEELEVAKRDMTNIFEQCQILPGEDGYEYDKRIDFEPDEESSWD